MSIAPEEGIDPIQRAEFLRRLSELTREFKIGIGACGCCGSPWLMFDESYAKGEYTASNKPYSRDEHLTFVREGA